MAGPASVIDRPLSGRPIVSRDPETGTWSVRWRGAFTGYPVLKVFRTHREAIRAATDGADASRCGQ